MDHGVHTDGRPFIAMELLRGHPLSVELDRSGSITVKRAMRLFIRCLDALQAAHELNIVHRDLKPDNIFITDPNSRVEALHLLDFGIAHAAEGTQATQTGMLKGTMAYMAPERFANQMLPAGDVYALGLVAWELLAGRQPLRCG